MAHLLGDLRFAAYSPMMAVHVRSPQAPLLLDRRQYVTTLDPNVLVVETRMLVEQTNLGFALYDTAARVLVIIGLAAVALAALGVYGLVAYTVKQSAHEIGIRMAIGAPRAHIVQKYLSGGMRLGAIGVVIGIAVAVAGSRLMAALLYDVSPTDVASFAAATVLVLGAAGAASLLPAWRASRVDPLVALRRQ
jgi:putative ABC transport system permease protein